MKAVNISGGAYLFGTCQLILEIKRRGWVASRRGCPISALRGVDVRMADCLGRLAMIAGRRGVDRTRGVDRAAIPYTGIARRGLASQSLR